MTIHAQGVPAGVQLWIAGARPGTLTIGASPIIVGAVLAFFDQGGLDWLVLAVTLICALAIQAGTNLYNDAADGARGHDTPARLGPARLTAKGWATATQVKRGAALSFALAMAGGVYLIFVGGWPIALIGILSIASGYAYSAGPAPLSHTALSEVFVIAFFGIAAVVGTYFLQTGAVTATAVLCGLVVGLLGAAVLMVNNARDRREDGLAGRRTLAIVAGQKLSQAIYGVLIAAAFTLHLANELGASGAGNWLPLLAAPFGLFLVWRFRQAGSADDYNRLLIQTAKLQFAFSMLFAVGLVALKLGHAG